MKPIIKREVPKKCLDEFNEKIFNRRFGHLRVIGISDITDTTNVHFCICICDCGKLFHTRKSNILRGRTKSCCGYVSIEDEKSRFMSKVNVQEDGCWIWKGMKYKRPNGKNSYGRFETKLFPDEYLSHRLAFLMFKGPIHENIFACHICDIEDCVNPDHIFLGDRLSNTYDMVVKGRNARGKKNGSSKYTEEIVRSARECFNNGMNISNISKKLEIPESTIQKFVYRKSWKHI